MFCSITYADESPTIYINGKQLVTENQPVIEDGRTLVPLRSIFETFNQTVTWSDYDKSITSGQIWLQLNNKTAIIGNKKVTLDVSAKLINDRTYLPLRFIAEALGKEVKYDAEKNIVEINNYLSINERINLIISGLTRSSRFLSNNAYSERYKINNQDLKIWELLDEQSKIELNKNLVEKIKSNVSSKKVYIYEFELMNEANKVLTQYKYEDLDLKIKVKEREFIENIINTENVIYEAINYLLGLSSWHPHSREYITSLIKQLEDHPLKYDALYNALIDYYTAYLELNTLIENPRGPYISYITTKNNLQSRLTGLKAKLDLMVPKLDE